MGETVISLIFPNIIPDDIPMKTINYDMIISIHDDDSHHDNIINPYDGIQNIISSSCSYDIHDVISIIRYPRYYFHHTTSILYGRAPPRLFENGGLVARKLG